MASLAVGIGCNGIAVGAPVVIVEGSMLVHIPTQHRLGQGSHSTPISGYRYKGFLPLRWTTVCGLRGTVLVNRGHVMADASLCPDCVVLSYHARHPYDEE